MAQKKNIFHKTQKNAGKSVSRPLTAISASDYSAAAYAKELFKPSKDS